MTKKQKNSSQNNSSKKILQASSYAAELKQLTKFLKERTDQPTALSSIYQHFKGKLPKGDILTYLHILIKKGLVKKEKEDQYYLTTQQKNKIITGKVDFVHPMYAYIIIGDGQPDVLVRKKDLGTALDQDQVKLVIIDRSNKRHPLGKVIAVLNRSITKWVGTIQQKGSTTILLPTTKRLNQPILIKPENLNGAKAGDRVAVSLLEEASTNELLEGKVITIFGKLGEHTAEMHLIMAEFNLPEKFPTTVVKEANLIPTTLPPVEISKRRDFRNIPTLTIDPEDAKDFDDALSLRTLPNGHFEVGVHIADVSYYIPEGGAMDQEAFERGTSVYLVDQTIPMLPEKLSNELCSLRPNEDRFAFSIVFELDPAGNLHKEWIGETVIHSHRRLTYSEAQQAINDSQKEFHHILASLNDLAKKLRNERFKKGAINFETASIKFQLDQTGKPLSVLPSVSEDSHRLIEEFMLLANKRIALHVKKMYQGSPSPTFVYRVHDQPKFEKMSDFALFVKQFGYSFQHKPNQVAQSLNALATQLQNKPEAHIIQTLAIRLMAKASYTTEAKPHFGLAFEHYTHFTSPIRRYPDLLVHRLLKKYLQANFKVDQVWYEKQCQHASERERIAAEAERASIKYKQVEWMQPSKGKIFQGIISHITEWGLYIDLLELFCEGMVRLADVRDDYYLADEKKFKLIGQRTKKTYQLGDLVNVRIKDCDITKRTIDLFLLDKVKKEAT